MSEETNIQEDIVPEVELQETPAQTEEFNSGFEDATLPVMDFDVGLGLDF